MNGVVLNRSQSLTLNIAAGGTSTDLSIGGLTLQPDPVEAKGPLSITVTAHNAQSGASAANVNVSVIFSQPVRVIAATLPGACSVNAGSVTCTVSTPFSTGQDAPFTIQVVPGVHRNLVITATVSSTSVNDSDMTNNVATATSHACFWKTSPVTIRKQRPFIPLEATCGISVPSSGTATTNLTTLMARIEK